MVKFGHRKKAYLKFHGPNQSKSTDSDNKTTTGEVLPDLDVKEQKKAKKPAKCSEQTDCPLRTKCKAGVCQ